MREIETKRAKIRLDLEKQAAQAQDNQLVKTLGDGVAAAYQSGSELEIAERIQQGLAEIDLIEDPARKNAVLNAYQRETAFQQMRRDASDLTATEKFLARAEQQNWSPTQMKAALMGEEGFSRAGKENLFKQIESGLVNKSTPANREALDRLLVEINMRQRSREPMTSLEVEAFGQQYGLTVEQINTGRKYLKEGGLAGQPGLAGKVKDLVVELTSGQLKDVPPGLLTLVINSLPPGDRVVSPEELRQIVGDKLLPSLPGESMSGSWLKNDPNETYPEAVANGRGDIWLPEVEKDEKIGLEYEMRALGIPVNSLTLRIWKKSERLLLPLSAEHWEALGLPPRQK